MLGFNEWLKLHDLASKKKGTYNDQLMKNLQAKFKWVKETAEKLKIPPPYHLTLIELTSTEKKRKRIMELVKQVFLDKEVVYELATTVQLLRMHNIIIQDSDYARDVAAELMLLIKLRHDYVEAKDIATKNLDDYEF
ncbi:hypothetical protein Tco_1284844 [Tanacetum coccineum]